MSEHARLNNHADKALERMATQFERRFVASLLNHQVLYHH
jgi:hypothetical protein